MRESHEDVEGTAKVALRIKQLIFVAFIGVAIDVEVHELHPVVVADGDGHGPRFVYRNWPLLHGGQT